MYKEVKIKNFRLFRDFKISGLDRINLFAGGNNVGKTSLLEALYLHQGPNNPDLAIRINAWRGREDIPRIPKELWSPLFYELELMQDIEISSIDNADQKRTLKICLSDIESTRLISTKGESVSFEAESKAIYPQAALQLTYSENGTQKTSGRAYLTSEGVAIEMDKTVQLPNSHFVMTNRNIYSITKDYGTLQSEKREMDILNYLKLIEPNLQELITIQGQNASILWGDLGGKLRLPLYLLGSGINRLLSILLAIYNSKDGITLIDEIENGIHHKYFEKVWAAIAEAAEKQNVQIFATTHSDECLFAAHQALQNGDKSSFKFFRLDRKGNKIIPAEYDLKTLSAAIEMNLEVR